MLRGRWLMAFLLIAGSSLSAKEIPEKTLPRSEQTGKFMYQEVVQAAEIPAPQLYSRAKAWVAVAYKSAQDVIQLDDKVAGRLICKGNFATTWLTNQVWVRHLLTIEVKDGRYRYTLTDFEVDTGRGSPAPLERLAMGQRKLLERTAAHAEALVTDLKAAMASQSPAGDNKW